MENIERIKAMEQRLNRALEAVREMEDALKHYETVQKDIHILDNYLGSDDWKADMAADEAGLLPIDLKRGVLSEDGIWNMLDDINALNMEMIRLATDATKDE